MRSSRSGRSSGASRASSGRSELEKSTNASTIGRDDERAPRSRGTRRRRSARPRARARRRRARASPRRRARARAGRSRRPARRVPDGAARSRRSASRRRRSRSGGSAPPRTQTRYARTSHGSRSWIPCAPSSHCQRQAIGSTVTSMIAAERKNQPKLASAIVEQRLADVDLPEDVGEGETGDEKRREDARGSAHPAKRSCTRCSAAIASSTSASECAGESGSDSTSEPARSATGSDTSGHCSRYHVSRCTGRKWIDVPMFSSVSARWYSSRVAPARSAIDAHDVEVQRVQVARVARERRDPVELRDRRVVERDVALADRAVRVDLPELHERDRGEHVAEVRLVAGHADVVERAVPAPHQPPVADRLGDVVAVGRDDAALARGDVLRRVEGEARRVDDRADLAAPVDGLERRARRPR